MEIVRFAFVLLCFCAFVLLCMHDYQLPEFLRKPQQEQNCFRGCSFLTIYLTILSQKDKQTKQRKWERNAEVGMIDISKRFLIQKQKHRMKIFERKTVFVVCTNQQLITEEETKNKTQEEKKRKRTKPLVCGEPGCKTSEENLKCHLSRTNYNLIDRIPSSLNRHNQLIIQ